MPALRFPITGRETGVANGGADSRSRSLEMWRGARREPRVCSAAERCARTAGETPALPGCFLVGRQLAGAIEARASSRPTIIRCRMVRSARRSGPIGGCGFNSGMSFRGGDDRLYLLTRLAEAPFATRILGNRSGEIGLGEIGPEHRGENILGISALQQKKIADARFA